MIRSRSLIVFSKLMEFSGTNAQIEAQLRKSFPEAELLSIQLKSYFRTPSWNLFCGLSAVMKRLLLQAMSGHSLPKATIKDSIVYYLLRERSTFVGFSNFVQRVGEANRARVLFTIQASSMWDGSVKGIPHFIYTDSASLTNLYLKDFDVEELPSGSWLACERESYKSAACLAVMSEHVKKSMIELYGIPASKIVNIKVGANLQNPPTSPDAGNSANKTILFVGVQWEKKGGGDLLAAFRMLPERHYDARLVVVGVSPVIDDPRCVVVGRVPAEEVTQYYQQAAIFCLPTRIDAFGIVYIEAMMHSLAVVSPRQGAMPDFIVDKVSGMFFEPGNVPELAKALTFLLDNPEERQNIAIRGFKAVHGVYDWDAVGHRLKGVIAPLLPRGTK